MDEIRAKELIKVLIEMNKSLIEIQEELRIMRDVNQQLADILARKL